MMLTLLDPDMSVASIAVTCFLSGYILGRFGEVRGRLWRGHRHDGG